MTNRVGDLSQIWASNGEATDPDLDTTHPIFQPNKYIKGWKVEKEPHQWQNFLYQISDEKLLLVAQEQILEWESDIGYAKNGITRKGDKLYKNVSGAVSTGKDPTTETSVWNEVLSMDSAGVVTAVTTLTNTLNAHLAVDNPHKDNIHDIGGYESGEIDKFFGDPNNPATIVYHENQTGGKVHGETPAQVGTLPTSGGAFTGDVNYVGGLTIGTGSFRIDGPDQKITNAGGSLFLEGDGDTTVGVESSGVRSDITTVANFDAHQIAVNNSFALPQPILQMQLRAGTFDTMGVGNFIVETTDAPVFEGNKGWKIADNTFMTWVGLVNIPATIYFEYYAGDIRKFAVVDATQVVVKPNLKIFLQALIPDATHLCVMNIYLALTEYQKLHLKPKCDSLHIANDTSSTPGTAWYVSKVTTDVFQMPNATAPKNGQYIGAFRWSPDDVRGARLDGSAVWTTSDSSVVQIVGSTQANGQAVVNILKAGTATLTVKWNGLAAILTITAV